MSKNSPAGKMRDAAELWQNTTDLQTIREPAAIANLPAEDRAACNRLWTEVAGVLKKTSK